MLKSTDSDISDSKVDMPVDTASDTPVDTASKVNTASTNNTSLSPHKKKISRKKKTKRYQPTRWRAWYERALHMSLAGFNNREIAKKVAKTPETVCRVMKSKLYQNRLKKLLNKADEAALKKALTTQQRLEGEKEKLFELALNMIYGYECENEGVRASLLKWMLEKFPEFLSQKERMIVGIKNETNVTMQVTEQQLQRQKEVAKDLRGVRKLLNKGNPFVIERTPLDDNLLPITDNTVDRDISEDNNDTENNTENNTENTELKET